MWLFFPPPSLSLVDGRHLLPGNTISLQYFGDTLYMKALSVSPVSSSVLGQPPTTSCTSECAGDLSDSHDIDTKFGNLSVVDISGTSDGDSCRLLTDEGGKDVTELASIDAIRTVFRIRARTRVTFDVELDGLAQKQVTLAIYHFCLASHTGTPCMSCFVQSVVRGFNPPFYTHTMI